MAGVDSYEARGLFRREEMGEGSLLRATREVANATYDHSGVGVTERSITAERILSGLERQPGAVVGLAAPPPRASGAPAWSEPVESWRVTLAGSEPREVDVLAAITAAGTSSRMGQTKALLYWGQTTLLGAMARTLRSAGLDAPAVVVGSDGDRVAAEALRVSAEPLWNTRHACGRFTSVRVAARWALARRSSDAGRIALLLWPVDCPGVQAATIAALGRAARVHPRANVAPAFRGRAGHPVVLCEETLRAIVAAPDSANLRDLLWQYRGGRRLLDVADPSVLDNLNDPAAYAAFVAARMP